MAAAIITTLLDPADRHVESVNVNSFKISCLVLEIMHYMYLVNSALHKGDLN